MRADQFVAVAARLGILALLVLGGDRWLASGLDREIAGSRFRFSLVQRGGLTAKVLVLGDSRAVNGFYAPKMEHLTGVSVLNLGYNGMSMLIEEAVLRDYLTRNAAPALLVLEVTNVQDEQALLDGLMCY